MSDEPPPGPRYRQIVRYFEQRIDSCDLMPGQTIPPVVKIAEQFGVAPETAARAVRVLRDGGYVHTSTQGTFVIDRLRVGVYGVEALPYPHETGCRSTIHCANYGFCNRCSPELARAASFALQALKEVGREWDGELYGKVMTVIRDGMGDMSESSSGS